VRPGGRESTGSAISLQARPWIILGATLVALGAWLMVRHSATPRIDRDAFRLLAPATSGRLARAAPTVRQVAEVTLAACILAALGFMFFRRAWGEGLVIVAGLAVSQTAAHIAKAAVARPRPPHGLVSAGGFSFPSTTSALGVSLLFISLGLAPLIPERARTVTIAIGALLTIVLGLSFIALRVHYLTDVLAGWALGVIVFLACDSVRRLLAGARSAGTRPEQT
jgi:membrane-associated phospholipid phosphatase